MSVTNGGDRIEQQKTSQRGARGSIKSEHTKSKLHDCPPTKDGYRYCLCEDDPLPEVKKMLAKLEGNYAEIGRRFMMPAFVKRKVVLPVVRLSESDRAQQLKLLSDDCMRVKGEKGYCMVRATHCINRDKWYYEATIDEMPNNSATRIGWSQRYANLQAPLGYDIYGYSYRSRLGTKFFQAKGCTFDKGGGYRLGDTIGCMIDLPYGNENNMTLARHLAKSLKETAQVVIDRKKKDSGRVFEDQDIIPENLNICSGSKISYYKNGKFVGTAFHDINDGFYFPTISIYKDAIVSVNFGPVFKYPPEKHNENDNNERIHCDYRPIEELPQLEIIDVTISDLISLIDQQDKNEETILKCIEGSKAEKI